MFSLVPYSCEPAPVESQPVLNKKSSSEAKQNVINKIVHYEELRFGKTKCANVASLLAGLDSRLTIVVVGRIFKSQNNVVSIWSVRAEETVVRLGAPADGARNASWRLPPPPPTTTPTRRSHYWVTHPTAAAPDDASLMALRLRLDIYIRLINDFSRLFPPVVCIKARPADDAEINVVTYIYIANILFSNSDNRLSVYELNDRVLFC